MSWLKLSAILEPENLTRRIYGFDTFEGFPSLDAKDEYQDSVTAVGGLASESEHELNELVKLTDQDRFLGHIPKAELIRGDIACTAPEFLERNPHLLVSLLFIDCDLYEPTKVALETFVPRMPKGAILAFDELDNPQWPGETLAVLDGMGSTTWNSSDSNGTPTSPSRGSVARGVLILWNSPRVRIDAVNMTNRGRSSHVGSILGMADILGALYGGVLRFRTAEPKWPGRDRVVLSKGARRGWHVRSASRGRVLRR